MTFSYELVKEKKSKLNFPSDLFINGNYHKSISENFFDNISPIDGKIINQISFAQQPDIDKAVSSGRKAFEKGHWSNMPPGQRKKILLKFAQLIERDRLELSLLDTIDMGKTINDTYNADLPTSIDNIEWYAEIIDKLFDLLMPKSVIFGKKDYQQLFLVRHFAKHNYPKIKIIGGETIRNKDGLALSSRNNLLTKEHLIDAANLYKALQNIVNQAIVD